MQTDPEIANFLEKDEQVLYSGKPEVLPFVLQSLPVSIFGCFFFSVPLFMLVGSVAASSVAGSFSLVFSLFTLPFLLIGLLVMLTPLWSYISYKKIKFVLTNKRVFIARGWVGRDYKFINYENIKNVSVNVGLFDKLAGKNTGSVSFFSGEFSGSSRSVSSLNDTFVSIQNPYDIFKQAKELIEKNRIK